MSKKENTPAPSQREQLKALGFQPSSIDILAGVSDKKLIDNIIKGAAKKVGDELAGKVDPRDNERRRLSEPNRNQK